MDQTIKLWGRATSINVQKVAWVIAELELTCDRIDAGGAFGGLDDPKYIALNPNRRVPTLIDGDLILWESNTICRYLIEKYGNLNPIKGQSIATRAQADMWMEWFQNTAYSNFIALFYQAVRLPPSQRDGAKKEKILNALASTFAIVDQTLEGRDFILGPELSLADVPFGACLYRYFTMDIPRPDHPNIKRYYANLTARRSYRDHVMIDFSALQGSD